MESYYPAPTWDMQKWFKIYRIKLQWFTVTSSHPGMLPKFQITGLP